MRQLKGLNYYIGKATLPATVQHVGMSAMTTDCKGAHDSKSRSFALEISSLLGSMGCVLLS